MSTSCPECTATVRFYANAIAEIEVDRQALKRRVANLDRYTVDVELGHDDAAWTDVALDMEDGQWVKWADVTAALDLPAK